MPAAPAVPAVLAEPVVEAGSVLSTLSAVCASVTPASMYAVKTHLATAAAQVLLDHKGQDIFDLKVNFPQDRDERLNR